MIVELLLASLRHLLRIELVDQTPTSVRFVVPTTLNRFTKEPAPMPFHILNDVITVVPIEFDNVGGTAVRAPSGRASVTTDATNFTVALGTANADQGITVWLTPVIPAVMDQGGTVTFTDVLPDGTSLTATLDVLVSLDAQPSSAHFNTDGVSTLPLNLPTSPVTGASAPVPGAPVVPTAPVASSAPPVASSALPASQVPVSSALPASQVPVSSALPASQAPVETAAVNHVNEMPKAPPAAPTSGVPGA